MSADKDDIVYQAKLAEQAERYDEMVQAMKKVAEMGVQLSIEERNLLSVAYKNVIGARRSAWRIISSIEQKEIDKNATEERRTLIKTYREMIESGIINLCQEIIDVVHKNVLPVVSDSEENYENKVFFLKMLGDYYRYIAEISSKEKREEAQKQSLKSYNEATKAGEEKLSTTHPIRLGLALNFSVFYYEIMNSPTEACKHAKKAFDDAIKDLDALDESSYKDSTLIMQLLRDNLTLWTSEENEQDIEVEDVGDDD